jgi:hypothetical protein
MTPGRNFEVQNIVLRTINAATQNLGFQIYQHANEARLRASLKTCVEKFVQMAGAALPGGVEKVGQRGPGV